MSFKKALWLLCCTLNSWIGELEGSFLMSRTGCRVRNVTSSKSEEITYCLHMVGTKLQFVIFESLCFFIFRPKDGQRRQGIRSQKISWVRNWLYVISLVFDPVRCPKRSANWHVLKLALHRTRIGPTSALDKS